VLAVTALVACDMDGDFDILKDGLAVETPSASRELARVRGEARDLISFGDCWRKSGIHGVRRFVRQEMTGPRRCCRDRDGRRRRQLREPIAKHAIRLIEEGGIMNGGCLWWGYLARRFHCWEL
jgi:coenzyme F420-reducing hydrogenase gamma subunit